MQFLVYDPHFNPEAAAAPPSPELMVEMGKFIAEAMQANALVTTGALAPKGTRLTLKDGKFSVTYGAFIELKELMGGWAVIRPSRWKKRSSGASASARSSGTANPRSCSCSGPRTSLRHSPDDDPE
ncbi:MAG: hypothetical protein IPO29_08410 [Anaerolineae bacterium]|nr:hypothetical protein [Anaerolineae bacterium]